MIGLFFIFVFSQESETLIICADIKCCLTVIVLDVYIDIFIEQHDEIVFSALFGGKVQGTASGCDHIQIDRHLSQ